MNDSRMHRRRDERGVTAIVVSICAVVLLVIAALVVDLGMVRLDRTSNKLATDAAATGGMEAALDDGEMYPYVGACSALDYLRSNHSELADLSVTWQTGAGGTVTGDPCAAGAAERTATCQPGNPSTYASFTGTTAGGRISVEVDGGYTLPDPRFTETGSATSDLGEGTGCDQVAVIVTESRTPGFGRLVTDGNLASTVRSVGRMSPESTRRVAVALLLLERTDCKVVEIEGAAGARVRVRGINKRPGQIHSDSLGSGPSCSSSSKVFDGNFAERIYAERSEIAPTRPGVITTVALSGAPGAVPSNASDPAPQVVAQDGAVAGGALIGRGLIDASYRAPAQATSLEAQARWAWTPTQANGAGFTVVGCSPTAAQRLAQKVFVNCANFTTAGEFTGTEFVFNGNVSSQSAFPNATRMYIKGNLTVTTPFQTNHGAAGYTCADRFASNRFASARMVVGGVIDASGGVLRLCQTAVIMANSTCSVPTVDGLPPYSPTGCSYLSVTGTAQVDWTAPNVTSSPPTRAQLDNLEGLALWTESLTGNKVEGNGTVGITGVVFAPNAAPFRIAGGGTKNMEKAQMIVRRLQVGGGGTLTLRPLPADVVAFPIEAIPSLVR